MSWTRTVLSIALFGAGLMLLAMTFKSDRSNDRARKQLVKSTRWSANSFAQTKGISVNPSVLEEVGVEFQDSEILVLFITQIRKCPPSFIDHDRYISVLQDLKSEGISMHTLLMSSDLERIERILRLTDLPIEATPISISSGAISVSNTNKLENGVVLFDARIQDVIGFIPYRKSLSNTQVAKIYEQLLSD